MPDRINAIKEITMAIMSVILLDTFFLLIRITLILCGVFFLINCYNLRHFCIDGTIGAVWGGTATGFKEVEAPSYAPGSDDGFLPGFEALFAVFAMGTFVIIRRRKKLL